ncbi:MAG: RraA family protein [Rhodobacteraceae bacterium]|nr:RraA family protein [Paracoccaceae bacterium]
MQYTDINRPSAEIMGRISNIATSTYANAFDTFGIADNIMSGLAAAAPGFRFSGPAVTVRLSIGPPGTYSSADFAVGAMIDAARKGDIIVVDGGGCQYSTWGGMASYAAKLKGVSGLLVDGAVRDLEEMIEFNFPVFTRHIVPTTGRTRLKVEAINVPVTVGGAAVNPGDIIVADGSGVVSIPCAQASGVLEQAEKCQRDDDAAMADLKNGLSFTDAMKKYRNI